MSNVEKFYDDQPRAEWERLERHRIEFQVTVPALSEFLPSAQARLMEVGGDLGRYAIWLDFNYPFTLEPCLLGVSDLLL